MNEYIILHDAYEEKAFILMPISKIIRCFTEGEYNICRIFKSIPDFSLYEDIRIIESPSEIEALIMGKSTSSPSIDHGPDELFCNLLDEKTKLEQENAHLKAQLDCITYPGLNSHMGVCIFAHMKSKRICPICSSKLEIADHSHIEMPEGTKWNVTDKEWLNAFIEKSWEKKNEAV